MRRAWSGAMGVRHDWSGSKAGARAGTATRYNSAGGPLHARQRVGGGVSDRGEVPHLAARARAALAVEKEPRARDGERRREVGSAAVEPEIAEQVDDRRGTRRLRRAERQVAHGAHELLELARRAGQLGRVKRVVRAGRELVDEQPAVARAGTSRRRAGPRARAAPRCRARARARRARRADRASPGSTHQARIWRSWWFTAGGYTTISPDARRATITDSSRSRSSACSATAGRPPSDAHALRRVAAVEADLAPAVVAALARLHEQRRPDARATPRRATRAESTCAYGPTGKPCSASHCFWRPRCCTTRRRSAPGRTGACSSAASSAAGAICSISSVTTSDCARQLAARRRRRRTWRRRRDRRRGAPRSRRRGRARWTR